MSKKELKEEIESLKKQIEQQKGTYLDGDLRLINGVLEKYGNVEYEVTCERCYNLPLDIFKKTYALSLVVYEKH